MNDIPDSIPFDDISFEALKSSHNHLLPRFRCDNADLEEYLNEDALTDQNHRISSTFLAIWRTHLVGYFTLTNDCIDKAIVQKKDGEKGYRYRSYPSLKIARLATSELFKGHDIGTHMVSVAYIAYGQISQVSGCRLITVDAKTSSVGFYEKIGFKKVRGKPRKYKSYCNSCFLCGLAECVYDDDDDKDIVMMYIDYHQVLMDNSKPLKNLGNFGII